MSDEELLGAMFQSRLNKIEKLEKEVADAWALLHRAENLIAQASHMVYDSSPNWHNRAEEFLQDTARYLR